MRKTFHYGVTRALAWLLCFLTLCVFHAPPAAALHRTVRPPTRTDRLSSELRAKQKVEARKSKRAAPPDVQAVSAAELEGLRARGAMRNRAYSGAPPWQRTFRDVNLATGNLLKSFTDVQVKPARGGGLAFQRTYNSNDDRVGPFGVGWTHDYEIRIEEAGNNEVPRTDFFGGKHAYHRDADGLYSPPAYMFDELSSEYENFLVNGPAEVLDDAQKGMDGTIKHFVANGDARTCDYIEDRHGNRTELTYGLNVGNTSLLTRVTDPSGRFLEITWSNLGTQQQPAYRIVEVAGPYDANTSQPIYRVTYEYNGDLNLWKVHQDPSGLNRVTTFTYTTCQGESGLLASVTDPLNHTVSYTYSTVNSQNEPNYTGTVWVSSVTEPVSGGTLTWNIWSNYNGPNQWPFSGHVSSDELSFYVVMDPQMRFVYLHGNGYFHFTTYDSANNVLTRTRMSTIFGPDSYYDPSPTIVETMTYGPHGNVLTHQLGSQSDVTTTSYYNASKYFQKESVTDPNGNVSRFDYFDNADPNIGNRGEVKWVRDARYSVTGRQFEFTYNQYGQKLTETNLNNVVTEFAYEDAWGNRTEAVQDPGSGHLNRTTTTTYDVAGRVISNTDPKGQTSTFQYNAVGQPTTANLPGETVTYSYGANGRPETMTDARGTKTLTYESGNDRVAAVTEPVTGAISFTYDALGQTRTIALPGGGTWELDYETGVGSGYWIAPTDEPDQIAYALRRLIDDQGRIVDYYGDSYGRLHRVRNNYTFSGGQAEKYLETRYTYDTNSQGGGSRGWLKQIKNVWRAKNQFGQWQETVLVQNDYTYDDGGNRLTNTISDQSGPIRTETYGYDELSRLTSVNYGDGETQAYTFDPLGNRLTKAVNGVSEAYTYNAANALQSRGATNYTFDLNGNTLTDGVRVNTWDGQDRLIQCVFNGATTTHSYGHDGLRRRTVEGSNTTDYVLYGQAEVRTFLNSSVDRTFLYGPRGPEYERVGSGDPAWYVFDGLGSVIGTVDKSGALVSTRKFDVYGCVRGNTGPQGTKHKFVGALGHSSDDQTGLIYMRARYYDPATGRFQSEDPARDGSNWFEYADSNPVCNTDPTGLATLGEQVEVSVSSNTAAGGGSGASQAYRYMAKKIGEAVEDAFWEIVEHLMCGETDVEFDLKRTSNGIEITHRDGVGDRKVFLDIKNLWEGSKPDHPKGIHLDFQQFNGRKWEGIRKAIELGIRSFKGWKI